MSVSIVAPVVKSFLRSVGYYRSRLDRNPRTGGVVLCYHGVLPDNAERGSIPFEQLHVSARILEEHCRVIAEYCTPLALTQFMDAIQSRSRLNGTPGPSKLPMLVTFDDGYANLLSVATPILERRGVPATVFACTEPMELGGLLWTDRAAASLGEADVERLKEATDGIRREAVSKTDPSPFRHEHCRLMNIDEFRQVASHPLWSVGGHTHTHPILARCSPEVQRDEVVRNLDRIEASIGRRPWAFAYPNGRPGRDYDETTKRILADSGVKYGFTTQAGFVADASRPLDIPRMFMTNGVRGTELLHRLAISWRR